MRNKYLRIGLPVGLLAVIAGVLLGIFLPGGGDKSETGSDRKIVSTDEGGSTAGAGTGAAPTTVGQEAGGGTGANSESATGSTESSAGSGNVAGEGASVDTTDAKGAADIDAEAEAGAGSAGPSTGASSESATGSTKVSGGSGSVAGEGVAADKTDADGAAIDTTDIAAGSEAGAGGAGSGTGAADQQVASATAGAGGKAPSGDASARTKPSFDVVRIDPKGGTVMAGRAEPGAEVIIRDGDQEIGRATANRRGEWVYTDDKPMPSGDRQFTLQDATPGGPESEQVVVVSVPKTEPGKEEQALAVLQPREGGPSVILQLPEEKSARNDGAPTTSVDTLDYGAEGEINVSGRAEPGARLNIYVDNEPIGTAVADEAGQWRVDLGNKVAEGKHDLRIDSVDQSGKVLARAETEFAKAPPTMLQLAGETLVIVQPGNSLWRIARRTYGGGVHYTDIYQANRDQIGDPDLIYPGQIFTVPPLG